MKCRYCNIALAPLRTLTDGEFCCDEHRRAYGELGGLQGAACQLPEATLVGLEDLLDSTPPAESKVAPGDTTPVHFTQKAIAPEFKILRRRTIREWFRLPDSLMALKFKGNFFNSASLDASKTVDPEFPAKPILPGSSPNPAVTVAAHVPHVEKQPETEMRFHHMAHDAARSWRWMVDAWTKAPSELRIITLILPVLLALAVSPSTPKVQIASNNAVQRMMTDRWNSLNKSILNRAAIAYTDDFRSGLDAWESRSNLTTSWSYDATGFVRPGPLAVFRPTVDLTDYRFEFLGEIDQKGLGFVFRAPNLDNYYAVKFAVVKPGPLPLVHMIRYAVIGGKEGPHVEKPLPLTVRKDMLYRVGVDVNGSDFAIMAQGQIVDFWTDSRLSRGGVGLFCSRGEKARVRWLEVSHQYDTLGRLCAYLAPYGLEGRNGNIN